MGRKRGISPLIATVLILGFTVALAAVIMVWGQRFTTGMQKQTEETATTQMKCATEVDFRVKGVCAGSGGYRVTVENNKGLKFDKLIVRFFQAADNVQTNETMFSASGVAGYSVSTEAAPISLSEVKYVEAIPIVTLSGKQVTCAANKQDFGSLDGPALEACS